MLGYLLEALKVVARGVRKGYLTSFISAYGTLSLLCVGEIGAPIGLIDCVDVVSRAAVFCGMCRAVCVI